MDCRAPAERSRTARHSVVAGAWRPVVPIAASSKLWSTEAVVVFGKPAPRSPVQRAARVTGSGESLDDLVRAHSAYVAGLAYRLLGRDADVDDVVQDVFFAFLRFHQAIREPAAVRAWLATTTVRLSHKRLRARARKLRVLLGLDDWTELQVPASGASPEEQAALGNIHRALEGVPAAARIAWLLRYVEQEQLEDVARLSGCSLATAKRWIALAQLRVRQALSDA